MNLEPLAHEVLLLRDDTTNAIRLALRAAERTAGTPESLTWQQFASGTLEGIRRRLDTEMPAELLAAIRELDADAETVSVRMDC